MKSLEFLLSHYLSYEPEDNYFYISLFYLLNSKNVANTDELRDSLDKIFVNINKNDIYLFIDFASKMTTDVNLLSRLYMNIMKLFMPNIFKKMIEEEILFMRNHTPDIQKEKVYSFFKYYFPYESQYDLDSYSSFKSNIFYFTTHFPHTKYQIR